MRSIPWQVVDPVEVDDVLEAREPHVEHGDEALTAGEHLGVVAVLGEERGDVGDRLGRVVLELCGFHRQLQTGRQREPSALAPPPAPGPAPRVPTPGRPVALTGRVRSVSDRGAPPEVRPDPIPAATVVLLRDGADGVETLMLRRDVNLAFAGGAWVFPGGRMDPEDYPKAARESRDAGDEVQLTAARNAAAREAMEEAGLSVDPSGLVWFAHWTPESSVPAALRHLVLRGARAVGSRRDRRRRDPRPRVGGTRRDAAPPRCR